MRLSERLLRRRLTMHARQAPMRISSIRLAEAGDVFKFAQQASYGSKGSRLKIFFYRL